MSKRIFRLFLLQLKEKVKIANTDSKLRFAISILLRLCVIIAATYVLSFVFSYIQATYGLVMNAHFLSFLLIILFFVCFLSTFSVVNNQLYRKNDNEFLLHMPVTATEIFISKILLCYVKEIIVTLSFMLPPLIAFGYAGSNILSNFVGSQPLFYLMASVFVFLLPVFTISVSVLISLPVSIAVGIIRKRLWTSLLTLIIMVALLFLAFTQIVSYISGNLEIFNQMAGFITKLYGDIMAFVEDFPFFFWLSNMLAGKNVLLGLSVFIGVTAVSLAVSLLISRFFYFKLALTPDNFASKNNKKRKNVVFKGPILSIIYKDALSTMHKHGALFENFGMSIIVPFLSVLIAKLMSGLSLRGYGIVLMQGSVFLILSLCTLLGNFFMASAISREGSNFYLLKICPVSYKKQAYAKIILANIIAAASLIVSVVIYANALNFKIHVAVSVAIFVLLVNFGFTLYCYETDAKKPQIKWYDAGETPNNKNAAYLSVMSFVVGLIAGLSAFLLIRVMPVSRAAILLIVGALIFVILRIIRFKHRIDYFIDSIAY